MEAKTENFYLTLSSNVINPDHANSIGNFRTTLASHIDLDGSWVVGLCELQYTYSWYNLKTEGSVAVTRVKKDKTKAVYFHKVPPGRYDSISKLIYKLRATDPVLTEEEQKAVDDKAEAGKKKGEEEEEDDEDSHEEEFLPILDYDEHSARFLIRDGKDRTGNPIYYAFSNEIADLIGTREGFVEKSDKNGHYKQGKRPYDVRGGIHNLYVYSDVVDFSYVGDVRAQLLRVAKIPNDVNFGDNVVLVYEKPYYLPVKSKNIETIEIDIKDDSGEPIKFMFGRVNVVLHFVRVD